MKTIDRICLFCQGNIRNIQSGKGKNTVGSPLRFVHTVKHSRRLHMVKIVLILLMSKYLGEELKKS